MQIILKLALVIITFRSGISRNLYSFWQYLGLNNNLSTIFANKKIKNKYNIINSIQRHNSYYNTQKYLIYISFIYAVYKQNLIIKF